MSERTGTLYRKERKGTGLGYISNRVLRVFLGDNGLLSILSYTVKAHSLAMDFDHDKKPDNRRSSLSFQVFFSGLFSFLFRPGFYTCCFLFHPSIIIIILSINVHSDTGAHFHFYLFVLAFILLPCLLP